ncbi:acetylornithine transaminase [bacterium]|nr:acetylornithine transaminase [bacterium]MBU1599144.1 acetylornithine transaminase [bacterium]MBU2462145.1 acetylornithine transaminase [bacterium]
MKNKDAYGYERDFLCPTYTRPEVLFVKGEGCRLWDAEGKSYLDLVGGLAVCSLGHCHYKVIEAIKSQSTSLIHTSNLYYTQAQLELAKKLSELSFGGKTFFCNSGAEANEAAIKLARLYGQGRYTILTAKGSFHGRTLATLSATGQEKIQKGFSPLVSGFKHIEFNSLESAESVIDENTVAIMLEPIQGESGIWQAERDYILGLRDLCDKYNLLLIFDEVQTGVGRCGYIFAYQFYGVEPDVITLAKGLGGGLPIGAMIAKKGVADVFTPGSHASTFGGNPVVSSAALAVLSVVADEGFLQDVRDTGDYLKERLREIPSVKDVRGMGLMIGATIDGDAKKIVADCLEKGLLINAPTLQILRFLPPLIITREEIDEAISILKDIL